MRLNPGQPAPPAAPGAARLGRRLAVLALALVLPLALLAGIAVREGQEAGRSRAEERLHAAALTAARALDAEMERAETGLRVLAASAALRASDPDGLPREMRALAGQPGVAAVMLFPGAGEGGVVTATAWPGAGETPMAEMALPAVRAARGSGRAVFGSAGPGPWGRASHVVIALPVFFQAEAEAAGSPPPPPRAADRVLALAIARERIAAVLAAMPPDLLPAEAVVLATDRDGIVVAQAAGRGPGAAAQAAGRDVAPAGPDTLALAGLVPGRPAPTPLLAALGRLAEGGQGREAAQREQEGEGDGLALSVGRAPRSGFGVAVVAPRGSLFAPVQETGRRFLLGGAGVLAICLLAGFAGARWIGAAGSEADAAPDGPAGAPRPGPGETPAAGAGAPRPPAAALASLAASERRFRALAMAGALVVWRSDASGSVLAAEGWPELTGQDVEEAHGSGWLAMLHPDDRPMIVAAWSTGLAEMQPVELEFRVARPGGEGPGSWRWVRARAVPLVEDGRVTEWVGVVETLEQRRHEARLQAEREQRLRLAIEAARLATWEFDVATGEGRRTGLAEHGFETPPDRGFGFDAWLERIHPDDQAEVARRFDAVICGEAAQFAAEFRVRRAPPEEGWAWIASYGAAVGREPATGRALRITGVAQDITERREAEQRRALLAREVDHRAKNALAVVQSVLRLARRDDPAAFVASVEQRVAALARVHTLLADTGWSGADLGAVARRELAGFPVTAVQLRGPPVPLRAIAVQPVALVLHELATNAAKHGALSVPAGLVTLAWRCDPLTERLVIEWSESGGPPAREPGPAQRTGFGTRLIEASVAGQLGGRLALHWPEKGLRVLIDLPAARVLAREDRRAPEPVAAEG